jgi:hypothetical protein
MSLNTKARAPSSSGPFNLNPAASYSSLNAWRRFKVQVSMFKVFGIGADDRHN